MGDIVAQLRTATDEFTPAADACNKHCALQAHFARLTNDLHEHVHQVNNIRFGYAFALEAWTAAA
jgi:regulator of cell morphogenesis and NO signaling